VSETITPDRAAELRDQGATFVDVREAYEHEAGHIAGDRYISLPELTEQAGSLDKDKPVVVYCRTGNRAELAAAALEASGWNAYNLEGGFVAWLEQGLPAEPENAEAAPHSPLP
jgi:rhodanese-related sulfurtransferase